ncbi:MAG: ABC transporter substrate-binding protein [Betaproteobacteria bacterium]|nr:ABC transporter substrate-binding protein [Betaproteobacteria bacterium]
MLPLIARVAAVAALAACCLAAPALANDMAPDLLVKNVTLEVMDIIRSDKDIQAGERKKVISLIEAKVLPHFNFNAMTAGAVARHWEKATPEQRARLIEEFRTLLVRTYASSIAAYKDQKFDFRPLRAKPTDTDLTVTVRVMQSGAQPVQLEYDMEKRPGGWKVWDVRVAGISLVANYRTEFDNQVREAGIEGLIKTLRTKNQSLERATVAGAERK